MTSADRDVATEMRRAGEALASHADDLEREGDHDQAAAVRTFAAGNLEIAGAIEAKDRRIADLKAEKANLVTINAALRDRPDLGDRARGVQVLEELLAEARAIAEEAARRHNELLANQRILRCAFCNAEYPPDTPPTQNEALTAHVKECPEHPMRELESKLAKLRAFAKHALERSWEGLDMDSCEIQEVALEHGLIHEVEGGFDPELHHDRGLGLEPGDGFYEFTTVMQDRESPAEEASDA